MPTVTLIGAGSLQFTQQIVSDLMQNPITRDVHLRLMDNNAAKLKRVLSMVQRMRDEAHGLGEVTMFNDQRTAIAQADYVISTILVGGFPEIEKDFQIAEGYGIHHTVGDTLGISGIFRGLRTIPALVSIARDCADLAPHAILLNYTNPMAMLVWAVQEAVGFPCYGLCHSAHYTAVSLAQYLDLEFEHLRWHSAGINHMAWMLSLIDGRHDQTDLYPALREAAAEPRMWSRDPVRFELMKRTGYFVTESSKHNAEYTAYFMAHPTEIARLHIPVGEYLHRDRPDLTAVLARQLEEPDHRWLLKPSPEYAPALIAALEAGHTWSFQANVPNHGLISNLPTGATVEVPALVTHGAIFPVQVGNLPPVLAALNRQAISVQELTVRAALNPSRQAVYEAAMMDPQLSARLTLDQIGHLVDDLLAAHQDIMPAYTPR